MYYTQSIVSRPCMKTNVLLTHLLFNFFRSTFSRRHSTQSIPYEMSRHGGSSQSLQYTTPSVTGLQGRLEYVHVTVTIYKPNINIHSMFWWAIPFIQLYIPTND